MNKEKEEEPQEKSMTNILLFILGFILIVISVVILVRVWPLQALLLGTSQVTKTVQKPPERNNLSSSRRRYSVL